MAKCASDLERADAQPLDTASLPFVGSRQQRYFFFNREQREQLLDVAQGRLRDLIDRHLDDNVRARTGIKGRIRRSTKAKTVLS